MKVGDRVKVESKDEASEGIALSSLENQKTKIIILLISLVVFVVLTSQSAYANHIVGFYADKNGYWSGGVKYYVHEASDVQFNVEDNGGDGLSLINGGVVVYRVDPNGDELVAVQCNQEELQNPDGICNNYDVAQNGKLSWNWDQKYYTGNQKKDDVGGDGQNDFVTAGKYYGIIITVPHKNYAAGTTQHQTQTFVLDADDDNDAIPNGADKCPQTFGSGTQRDALGCPDGDNDGVPDETDKCADKAETINGYLDSDGCPDDLFAGGAGQGRFCLKGPYYEQCKIQALKAEARQESRNTMAKAVVFSIAAAYAAELGGVAILGEAIEYYYEHQKLDKLTKDPADPNYKVVVELKKREIKFLDGSDKETEISNRLISTGADYADTVDAFISAHEKYLGAEEANDKYWIGVHATEVRKYAALAAENLQKFNSAFDSLSVFIKSGSDIIITKEQLIGFQNKLKAQGIGGLPAGEAEFIKNNLGGNETDLQELVNDIININSNDWNDEPLSAKLDTLKGTNQGLINNFKSIAKDFGLAPANMFINMMFVLVIIVTVLMLVKKYGSQNKR